MAPAEAPKLAEAPSWMTAKCPKLRKLPRKEYTQAETETEVISPTDKRYEECRIRHNAYVKWVRERDEKLSAQGK